MNATKPFYSHESDSKIMLKKDKLEVRGWTDDLEHVNEEVEYLLQLYDLVPYGLDLYQQLQMIRRENQLKLGALYRYEATIRNAAECDTTACDAYYLHNHEKNRNLYLDHIKGYRILKTKVFKKILLRTKRGTQ
ncbi:hypothetical protein [Pseudozobellia thermophila]|uniref:Uncharacterized protein n=1 Tax=Pseudozobellia thermophila TaxID=192903 RepID=A0A1M6EG71_9FLAO|nr:hypothetical protein [Pseudozobellia thermophila]SHI84517.1 hypothetical protein SAMN04488513_10251 [Pseudozobellia thermophila]